MNDHDDTNEEPELPDHDDDTLEPYDPRERHGHGVCKRPWSCIEPCGPTGGCIR